MQMTFEADWFHASFRSFNHTLQRLQMVKNVMIKKLGLLLQWLKEQTSLLLTLDRLLSDF